VLNLLEQASGLQAGLLGLGHDNVSLRTIQGEIPWLAWYDELRWWQGWPALSPQQRASLADERVAVLIGIDGFSRIAAVEFSLVLTPAGDETNESTWTRYEFFDYGKVDARAIPANADERTAEFLDEFPAGTFD